MDKDEMANELDRILGELSTLDPTSEKYKIGIGNYCELMKALHNELESCESALDHDHKRDLERDRFEQEKIEEEHRIKQAKNEVIWKFLEKLASVVGVAGITILIVCLEQSSIISQKAFSLVKMLFKP